MEAAIGILIMLAAGIFLLALLKNVINILGGLWAAYLLLVDDNFWGGIIVIGLLVVLNSALPDKKGNATDYKVEKVEKARKTVHKNKKSRGKSDAWMWLIPVLWPLLIFKTFFGGKQVPPPTPADYEHHLRCNGK